MPKSIKDYIEEIRQNCNELAKSLETAYNSEEISVNSLHEILSIFEEEKQRELCGENVIKGVQKGVIRGAIFEDFVRRRIDNLLKNIQSGFYTNRDDRKVQVPSIEYNFFADCVIRKNNSPVVIIECKISADPNWFLSTVCKFHLVKNESSYPKCYLLLAYEPTKTVTTLFNFFNKDEWKGKWIDGMFVFNEDETIQEFENTLKDVLK